MRSRSGWFGAWSESASPTPRGAAPPKRFIAAGKMAATSIPQQGVISVDAMNASAPMNGNGGGGASANDGAQRPAAVPSMGRTFSWQSLKIAQYGVTQ